MHRSAAPRQSDHCRRISASAQRPQNPIEHRIEFLNQVLGETPQDEIAALLQQLILSPIAAVRDGVRGRFQVNVDLPIAFDGWGRMEAIDANVAVAAVAEDLATRRSFVLSHLARFTSRGSPAASDGDGSGPSSSRACPSSTARL
jgi:hypothetical protein